MKVKWAAFIITTVVTIARIFHFSFFIFHFFFFIFISFGLICIVKHLLYSQTLVKQPDGLYFCTKAVSHLEIGLESSRLCSLRQ